MVGGWDLNQYRANAMRLLALLRCPNTRTLVARRVVRPLRQPLLAASAPGGARRRSPGNPEVVEGLHNEKTPTPKRVSEFFGPSGDNGFDQTPTKLSIYGPCAHFSSRDQNEKSHVLQKSSFTVQWYRKGGVCYER